MATRAHGTGRLAKLRLKPPRRQERSGWLRFASAAVCFASLRSADISKGRARTCFIRHDVGLWGCLVSTRTPLGRRRPQQFEEIAHGGPQRKCRPPGSLQASWLRILGIQLVDVVERVTLDFGRDLPRRDAFDWGSWPFRVGGSAAGDWPAAAPLASSRADVCRCSDFRPRFGSEPRRRCAGRNGSRPRSSSGVAAQRSVGASIPSIGVHTVHVEVLEAARKDAAFPLKVRREQIGTRRPVEAANERPQEPRFLLALAETPEKPPRGTCP